MSRYIAASESTKALSYEALNIPEKDNQVLIALTQNPQSSRSELAKITKLRLSTVTGAVRRLMDNNFIKVVGQQRDNETDRMVEILEVI